ncbi:hypothetical protein LF65_02311 [Clostridium beijerinckii]|uniref:HTH cro/C1-type domain-containing protein n=1 Tax=Clostridium beijerinckii TaxID=1520 RepID=A0A0B5QLL4_CLOBE|nr:helix-turn-helix transcriptional regulator [Clostridium beijerinckii]AJG98897.1 hypothetical protein LF65_02311 [Clostridium beijerinckii]
MNILTTYKINMFDFGKTIGDKLKFHRLKNDLTQDKLAEIVGFSKGSCIKDIELGRKLPGREISQKLALHFNLDTKYFYDTYLEETNNSSEKLLNYRKQNNLSIKEVCNLTNISITAWCSWENGSNNVSRDKYKLLKEYNIL